MKEDLTKNLENLKEELINQVGQKLATLEEQYELSNKKVIELDKDNFEATKNEILKLLPGKDEDVEKIFHELLETYEFGGEEVRDGDDAGCLMPGTPDFENAKNKILKLAGVDTPLIKPKSAGDWLR